MNKSNDLNEEQLLSKISEGISILSLKLLNREAIKDNHIDQSLAIIEAQIKEVRRVVENNK